MGRPVALFALVFVWLPLAGMRALGLNLAPEQPDAPWSPATTPDGEIVAGAPRATRAAACRQLCSTFEPQFGSGTAACHGP